MTEREQMAALIDAYIELARSHSYDDSQIIDALADIFDENELVDLGFGSFVEEYFHDEEAKRSQAATLPEGWMWKDFGDGSGSLEDPGAEKHFVYEVHPVVSPDGPEIEYRRSTVTGYGPWCTFYGTLPEFKSFAEKAIIERYFPRSLDAKISIAQQKAEDKVHDVDGRRERTPGEPAREA